MCPTHAEAHHHAQPDFAPVSRRNEAMGAKTSCSHNQPLVSWCSMRSFRHGTQPGMSGSLCSPTAPCNAACMFQEFWYMCSCWLGLHNIKTPLKLPTVPQHAEQTVLCNVVEGLETHPKRNSLAKLLGLGNPQNITCGIDMVKSLHSASNVFRPSSTWRHHSSMQETS